MDEQTVRMIARNRFAKLLQSPGCRWMCGDVAMHDAPCPDLHQEEHIESSKPFAWSNGSGARSGFVSIFPSV